MKRLIFVLLAALGWLFINKPLEATYVLYFTSSPTSWVGQGQTLTLTSPETAFSALRQGAYNNEVVLHADGYGLCLFGPDKTLPTVGFYPNATRSPFMDPGVPGLAFLSLTRGDNTLTGYFNVLQADYDISGNIVSFAVDFTQYDEGVTANWVSGSFRYNSNIPIPEPATILLLGLGFLMMKRKGEGQMD